MTQRRSVHSAGSPTKTPKPTTGANPDGHTPAELPSDPAARKGAEKEAKTPAKRKA